MAHITIGNIVARSALSKPATRLYPFEKRETYPKTRGHIDIDIAACTMCTLCQKKCPTHAITVKRAEKIWEIERMKCIQCSACVDSCPKKCLSMANTYSPCAATKEVESFIQNTPAPAEDAPAA
ncbi:MAG: 4Fe-4S dicluster domain-containing protein [Chitinispirillaceae bacterium]|jgi:formate hydrogenlyase subunit 6/NADH:ubiquinone oxidoreductase subunit I|nr:4Fe-4S dicluster domain-containing protein [Chitinispirillaceae bacterium]